MTDIFKGLGIKITLKNDKDFNSIVETLTRIGFASKYKKELYQSCHILHKRGEYTIMHFKEMFILDGKSSDISDSDYARRDKITQYLEDWGLLKIKEEEKENLETYKNDNTGFIKIISFKDKENWELIPKYSVGKKKN